MSWLMRCSEPDHYDLEPEFVNKPKYVCVTGLCRIVAEFACESEAEDFVEHQAEMNVTIDVYEETVKCEHWEPWPADWKEYK
jgi:hypothetical protein